MKAFLTGITKATIIRFSVMELTRERIYVASYQTPFYKMDGYIMLHLDDISIYVLSYFYNFTPDNYMKTSGASAKSENENIPLLNDIMEGCETALQYQGTSLTRVFGPAFAHQLIPRCKHKALPYALESLQANLHGHKG
ncbi:unnamed protein product [Lactuca saligna]|uniref:Uncharacterized protein n=1 Tax=Lactuca saligna TaxID=75948 RepID=A0AA35YRR6_LACSI|nr:unnamed protein product [Lactuca saligna]